VASAITLHMTDFDGAILNQYQEMDDLGQNIGDNRLCKVSARMTFHRDFSISDWSIFPHELDTDDTGALVKPDAFIDRNERAYPDGVRIARKC